jgi:hypothetical protein
MGREIEDDQMLMMFLRHEAGHALNYAYRLWERPDWKTVFGSFLKPYRDSFETNQSSREFVRHLLHSQHGRYYAQKHPDEDFAETFTVWLTPRSGWRKTYQRYPTALKKLRFTERLVKEIGSDAPMIEMDPGWMLEPYEQVKFTVAEFMNADSKRYVTLASGYVDADLRELFRAEPRSANRRMLFRDYQRADVLLKEQKQMILSRVSYWVGVDSAVVLDLLEKLMSRARALNLWVERAQMEKKTVELVTYITVLCSNYKHRGTYL